MENLALIEMPEVASEVKKEVASLALINKWDDRRTRIVYKRMVINFKHFHNSTSVFICIIIDGYSILAEKKMGQLGCERQLPPFKRNDNTLVSAANVGFPHRCVA